MTFPVIADGKSGGPVLICDSGQWLSAGISDLCVSVSSFLADCAMIACCSPAHLLMQH